MENLRPTHAKIDLSRLEHNYEIIKKLHPNQNVICVIKADAYGHGAKMCMETLKEKGANFFAVSSVYEALDLENKEENISILILGYVGDDMIECAIENNFRLCVYSEDFAKKVSAAAKKMGKTANVHIKLNTGMNRIGFFCNDEGIEAITRVSMLEGICFEGIFSHFSSSDEQDLTYTNLQFERYERTVNLLKEKGITFTIHHIANSSAAEYMPQFALDAVRAGIALYGFDPKNRENPLGLKPVMKLFTKVVDIHCYKESEPISYNRCYYTKPKEKVATLCIGYADGYNRLLANGGEVVINGRRYPVVGKVCMDMMMANVTGGDVKVGDEVLLFGDSPTATDLADICKTIDYEILCLVGKRVPRVYYRNGIPVGTYCYI